jgi:hypothetical protein
MRAVVVVFAAACTASPRPFPLREPLEVDPDGRPVAKMPKVYWSPLLWDVIDNSLFARVSKALEMDLGAESANANSLDEVADSSWFENRPAMTPDQAALGACAPDDVLPDEVADGAWIIEHGKDDGATPGFRVTVPGKGEYLLKADNPSQPERNSAASVIATTIYHAAGFNTACEQVVFVRRAQFTLKPKLKAIDNEGTARAFDEAALEHVLSLYPARADGRVRMAASKWLPGVALGPFRYVGTRDDDPNDAVPHENRRELRGSRLVAAWLNHFDAREQNSLDAWIALDPSRPKSAPGYVRHYILDTNDALGGEANPDVFTSRLGHSYYWDFRELAHDLVTLGADERPWERVHRVPGREKFGYFTADDFDPEKWKSGYPNPAFLRMTERDAAWAARIIAKLTPEHVRAIARAARFADPSDADYIAGVLVARRHAILARYLVRLSPIADVHVEAGGAICATDLALASGAAKPERFAFGVEQRRGHRRERRPIAADLAGRVCFVPRSTAGDSLRDDDRRRITVFELGDGVAAPLEIHAYDLGRRGFRIVGLVRRAR